MNETVTLYSFADVDRSGRARWLLAELGVPVDERRLDLMKGEHKSADYLKINPFGVVPAAQVNGETVFESGAICAYFADKYGEGKLAPRSSAPQRAAYYQWIFWACASLDPAVFRIFAPGKKVSPEELASHVEFLRPVFDVLSARLSEGHYVLGSEFSAADIIIGHTLGIAGRFGLLQAHPVLRAYVARLQEREGAKKARLFTAPFPGAVGER